MKNQMEQIVINKGIKFIIILISIISLTSCKNKNEDIKFLKVYFENCKRVYGTDSLFLAYNNTNAEIFKSYKRHLNLNNSKDSLKKTIFQKTEYENYKKQTEKDGTCNIDLNEFEDVFTEGKADENMNILHVTKPVYTRNKKYALIYSYRKKVKENLYFIPKIEVYMKQNNTWSKVSSIKHFEITSSPYLN